ncbi:PF07364 family protein [Caballeronia calidae]|uniref:PF07364 family protein n=1 Tax=Caballeronia calidae TaxID=1777139 RepID=A0A158CRZ1_9BURK|nr:PF07364 family protein [Caballeronia calidae]
MPSSDRTILIAGFQHETNTFAPSKAAYENFERGEGFPLMCRGDDVLALREVNIPAGGFIRAAEASGHTLVPVIWAGASPSAHVTRDAFERIVGEIVDAARTRYVDAVYLDLHGAMVAEHVDDGEGELLARVRKAVGRDIPIVASLDLHANVTERMLHNADALVAYRTYPHVDMAHTGARTAALLERLLAGETLHGASRRLPFLIPINGMCTRSSRRAACTTPYARRRRARWCPCPSRRVFQRRISAMRSGDLGLRAFGRCGACCCRFTVSPHARQRACLMRAVPFARRSRARSDTPVGEGDPSGRHRGYAGQLARVAMPTPWRCCVR